MLGGPGRQVESSTQIPVGRLGEDPEPVVVNSLKEPILNYLKSEAMSPSPEVGRFTFDSIHRAVGKPRKSQLQQALRELVNIDEAVISQKLAIEIYLPASDSGTGVLRAVEAAAPVAIPPFVAMATSIVLSLATCAQLGVFPRYGDGVGQTEVIRGTILYSVAVAVFIGVPGGLLLGTIFSRLLKFRIHRAEKAEQIATATQYGVYLVFALGGLYLVIIGRLQLPFDPAVALAIITAGVGGGFAWERLRRDRSVQR